MWLAAGRALVVEIGATQGQAVSALASAAGLVDVEVRPDLAGHDRLVTARRPGQAAARRACSSTAARSRPR